MYYGDNGRAGYSAQNNREQSEVSRHRSTKTMRDSSIPALACLSQPKPGSINARSKAAMRQPQWLRALTQAQANSWFRAPRTFYDFLFAPINMISEDNILANCWMLKSRNSTAILISRSDGVISNPVASLKWGLPSASRNLQDKPPRLQIQKSPTGTSTKTTRATALIKQRSINSLLRKWGHALPFLLCSSNSCSLLAG
jgi:hypothetical protein